MFVSGWFCSKCSLGKDMGETGLYQVIRTITANMLPIINHAFFRGLKKQQKSHFAQPYVKIVVFATPTVLSDDASAHKVPL